MLVLTRTEQKKKILIGDDIVVTIIRVSGKYVRVGIEAPQSVRILRGELADGPQGKQEEDPAQSGVVEPTTAPEDGVA